ncbi:AEC family transporter [Salinicola sp. RZ23]|uniref:AEC family transporter n=1 Tax=Salinicola sp. RZ23 TaxID=1949087 RepID=UPI000DA1A025|nr:AEC family transporter [Salinicola sp. RZ23]
MPDVDLSQSLWMLLAFVALGWVAARRLKLDPRPIATLLIYLISPLTFFNALTQGQPSIDKLALTFGVLLLSSLLCLAVNAVAGRFYAEQERALLAFSAGTGNTGYFGFPIALVLLPPEGVTQYLFCMLGISLYEFTVGFYISARGQFSVRESLSRLARLPLIYAFAGGMLISALGWQVPQPVSEGLGYFKYCFTVLGMMIIGMTLGRISWRAVDVAFVVGCVVTRFMVWPLATLALAVALRLLGDASDSLVLAFLLVGAVPMAANVVVIAMELNIRPEKGAIAVLLTTLAAPLLIPLYLGLVLPWVLAL